LRKVTSRFLTIQILKKTTNLRIAYSSRICNQEERNGQNTVKWDEIFKVGRTCTRMDKMKTEDNGTFITRETSKQCKKWKEGMVNDKECNEIWSKINKTF